MIDMDTNKEEGRDTLPNLIIACVGLIGLYLFLTGALT